MALTSATHLMTTRLLIGSTLLFCQCLAALAAIDPLAELDRCNVVWNSPSQDAHGSMPLGNGDVGVNAWVEPSGDLVFYVSKTDAWDENGRLCKIGRVRVQFDPPLAVAAHFEQALVLRDGVITIQSAVGKSPTKIRLWVDADQPVGRWSRNLRRPCAAGRRWNFGACVSVPWVRWTTAIRAAA